jgi:hypothetical protein
MMDQIGIPAIRRAALLLLVAGVPYGRLVGAQDAASSGRLDSATAAAVARLADSVRARSLPADQLLSLAREGALHHASAEQVLAAVRAYAAALGEARDAIGPTAMTEEIVSGAGLLIARVNPGMLTGLRLARAEGPLTVPLVVFADFIARGVTTELAFATISSELRNGARDDELSALRNAVAAAITAGTSPAAAISSRIPLRPADAHAPTTPRIPPRIGRPPRMP